jgi:hypothetical protein
MKKLLFLILLLICLKTNGQTLPSPLSIGGSFYSNSTKGEQSSTNIFNGTTQTSTGVSTNKTLFFSPQVGVVVGKKWILGVKALYNETSNEFEGQQFFNNVKQTSISGGLFGRYYTSVSTYFGLFGQVSFLTGSMKTESKQMNVPSNTGSGKVKTASFLPGIYLFLGRMSFELSFGDLSVENKDTSNTFRNQNNTNINSQKTKSSNFNIDLDRMRFGLTCFLGKKTPLLEQK